MIVPATVTTTRDGFASIEIGWSGPRNLHWLVSHDLSPCWQVQVVIVALSEYVLMAFVLRTRTETRAERTGQDIDTVSRDRRPDRGSAVHSGDAAAELRSSPNR